MTTKKVLCFPRRAISCLLLAGVTGVPAYGFRIFDIPELPAIGHPGGFFRWNTAPHEVDGVERSLNGGLRYSVAGGSFEELPAFEGRPAHRYSSTGYEALLGDLQWQGTPPSLAEFQEAVEQAFADWEQIDPATGLGTALRFVPDFGTSVVLEPRQATLEEGGRLNRGAEIDIAAVSLADLGVRGTAILYGDPHSSTISLTSGVEDYPATVFSGVDILMNSENEWSSLDSFRLVLSHEIGHALGLEDVDATHARGCCRSLFYDDNYDRSSRKSVRETLTNSFADLIDPLDPNNSPDLQLFDLCTGFPPDNPTTQRCISNPGLDTSGVNLHMETSYQVRSQGPTNDEFAGRQFLYPFVRMTGDYDADQELTSADIDLLFSELTTPEPRSWFDADGDGVVNMADLNTWVTSLFGTSYGDADLNGEVDFSDFVTLSGNFGQAGGWAQGDFDGSGDIQFADFVRLSANFGTSNVVTATVPEPCGRMLILLAGFSMYLLRPRYESNYLRSKTRKQP